VFPLVLRLERHGRHASCTKRFAMSTRYGILLLGDRVAPRCVVADSLLVAICSRQRIVSCQRLPVRVASGPDLLEILCEQGVGTLVCGGLRRELKEAVLRNDIQVIDNVAATGEEVVQALEAGGLHSGLGFDGSTAHASPWAAGSGCNTPGLDRARAFEKAEDSSAAAVDCLNCRNRVCLVGRTCSILPTDHAIDMTSAERTIMDAALDVGAEDERNLCRISELVYYGLEMGYRRIGVAFCIELMEQTEVLVQLLRRFFEVHPVCCKVGGVFSDDMLQEESDPTGFRHVACNPFGQSRALNRLRTDLNIIVGLCVGVDCLFARASQAPVTTLFVRDKSLVNNPIAAVYSEYHLDEVSRVSAPCRPPMEKGELT